MRTLDRMNGLGDTSHGLFPLTKEWTLRYENTPKTI